MGKLSIILFSALIFLSLTTANASAISQLHTEGKYIKDDAGNIVILRGVNAGGFGDSACGWFTTTFSDTLVRNNLAAMKTWGINAIRIMGTERWWLENSKENLNQQDVCTMTQRDAIIRTVQIAQEQGMYVIYTFWSIDTTGQRSPGIQDYLPYPPSASTQNYNTIRSSDDFVELWAGNSSTSSFLARFANVNQTGSPPTTSAHVHNNGQSPQSVIEALGPYPNVIYEFYNEPVGNDAGWSIIAQQIVDAIRARGDSHPIMVQAGYCGSYYSWFDTMFNKLSARTNIIYSDHVYRASGSFPNSEYAYADINRLLMTETKANNGFGIGYVLGKDVPAIIGETGASLTSSQELECLDSVLRVANENNVSWMGWEWRTGTGFALIGNNFVPTQSGQIVINYANITSQSPTHYSINVTGTVTDSSGQITEAAVTCGSYSSMTNAIGDYMLTFTAPVSCLLTASKSGYLSKNVSVSYSSNGTYVNNFALDAQVNFRFVSGEMQDATEQSLTAKVIVYQGGTVVNSTTASTYNLSVAPGVYDVQFNFSGTYVKLLGVDVTISVNNLINHVSQSSSVLSFTSPDNLNYQILSPIPSRVSINNLEISSNASLANNTYYYSNGIVYLKITPDLKTDCLFGCCSNEIMYRDRKCQSVQYCSSNTCYPKTACPYACCVNETQYIDLACSPGKNCDSNHNCVSTWAWTDGFESGNFNAWSSQSGSPSVTSSSAHLGSYKMTCSNLLNTGYRNSTTINLASSSASIYVNAYYMFNDVSLTSYVRLGGFGRGSSSGQEGSVAYDFSSRKWGIGHLNSGLSWVYSWESGTSALAPNTWYDAKIYANITSGIMTLWVDGTVKLNLTGQSWYDANGDRVDIGVINVNSNQGSAKTVYVDDVSYLTGS